MTRSPGIGRRGKRYLEGKILPWAFVLGGSDETHDMKVAGVQESHRSGSVSEDASNGPLGRRVRLVNSPASGFWISSALGLDRPVALRGIEIEHDELDGPFCRSEHREHKADHHLWENRIAGMFRNGPFGGRLPAALCSAFQARRVSASVSRQRQTISGGVCPCQRTATKRGSRG